MLKDIFSQFATTGSFQQAELFGSGHINDTYLVKTKEPNGPDYILQRINHIIFTQPNALMNNVMQVTQHMRTKLSKLTPHVERACLTVIPNKRNQPIVLDNNNHYWACYLYISDSYAHDSAKNPKQAYEGGKLIGRFLDLLSDFPITNLHETLSQFHNVDFRLNNFENALNEDRYERAQYCQNEVAFVRNNADEMRIVLELGRQGIIPLRVVHNDTKFNNLLLDAEDNGLCVIDLDTVMPGFVHYDFSDAVRTIANSSAEDEKELDTIHFDLELFAAFAGGFFSEIKNNLLTEEVNSLARAVPLMPFLHGTRFLTDYLSGDHYYKTHFPGHNLQRAKAQFRLVERMQEKIPEMNKIIQYLIF